MELNSVFPLLLPAWVGERQSTGPRQTWFEAKFQDSWGWLAATLSEQPGGSWEKNEYPNPRTKSAAMMLLLPGSGWEAAQWGGWGHGDKWEKGEGSRVQRMCLGAESRESEQSQHRGSTPRSAAVLLWVWTSVYPARRGETQSAVLSALWGCCQQQLGLEMSRKWIDFQRKRGLVARS